MGRAGQPGRSAGVTVSNHDAAPKRTSTERVRKHRALKDALKDETREAELRIPCTNLASVSEWLIECGELSPSDAEQPGAITKALAEKIRKLSA